VCTPPKIVDGVTPGRIGGICDHLCLVVVFSNNDVPGNTNTWQRPVVTFQLFPLLSVTLTDRARSRAGPQRYNVDGAWRRPGHSLGVGCAVPDRRMRTLQRLHLHHIVLVAVEAAL